MIKQNTIAYFKFFCLKGFYHSLSYLPNLYSTEAGVTWEKCNLPFLFWSSNSAENAFLNYISSAST